MITLKVEKFVLSKDAGGIPIPAIAEEDVYVQEYCKASAPIDIGQEKDDDKPKDRLANAEDLRDDYADAKKRLAVAEVLEEAAKKTAKSIRNKSPEVIAREKAAAEAASAEVKLLRTEVRQIRNEHDALIDKLDAKLERLSEHRAKWRAERTEKAHKQHQDDRNALRRLESCLDLLKRWSQLAKGCGSLEEICRKHVRSSDPLDAGDMRAVLHNLQRRFRCRYLRDIGAGIQDSCGSIAGAAGHLG